MYLLVDIYNDKCHLENLNLNISNIITLKNYEYKFSLINDRIPIHPFVLILLIPHFEKSSLIFKFIEEIDLKNVSKCIILDVHDYISIKHRISNWLMKIHLTFKLKYISGITEIIPSKDKQLTFINK